MPLAALSFSDPLMLAGLLAALIPILLHLLNRIRAPIILFPTLRFLKITAQKTARRRQIQQYFLLLLRVIVFAVIAMAVAAPLIRGGSPALAYGFVGMLLLGLGLLVLALVLGASAFDAVKSGKTAATATRAAQPTAHLWGFSLLALIAALLLGGYSAYGLVSDRFFTSNQPGAFTGTSTAMVIILDNSHSMLARDGPPPAPTRLDRAKTRIKQLLGEDLNPREAAIIPTNPGDIVGTPGLSSNMFVLAGNLEKMIPTGSARPMAERIRAALDILQTSQQPNKMLVIVSDFARPGYADVDVFSALKNLPWRSDLQVVLMPMHKEDLTPAAPGPGGGDNADVGVQDVGIASFNLAQGTQRPVVGAEVTFEAELLNNATSADVRDLIFTVDGEPVSGPGTGGASAGGPLNPRVQLEPANPSSGAARTTVRIPYRLAQSGPHRFGIQIQDSADAMAWDDSRQMVLDVADQIHVLVVGAEATAAPRPRSAAFFFLTALAPFEGAPGKPIPWSIKPVYRGIDQMTPAALQGQSAIFLCDVPRVSAPIADALVAYAKSGGRIIWVLGPSVDSANYNQILLGTGPGGKRALLPAPLAQPVVAVKASPLDWVDIRSGLFMNLFDSQEPFRNALITGLWGLDTSNPDAIASQGRTLAKLPDGSPVFVQHAATGTADTGRIYTLLTTPAAEWSNLGATVLLVPLASRMALGDFQEGAGGGRGGTSFDTGQNVPLRIPALDNTNAAALRTLSLDVTTPSSAVLNLKSAVSASGPLGTAQWLFDHSQDAGVYTWKSSDNKFTGMFVVNPPGEEADLIPADLEALAKESSPAEGAPGKPTLIAATVPGLLGQLSQRAEGTSLTPGFLAIVLMLAVVEALLANRHKAG